MSKIGQLVCVFFLLCGASFGQGLLRVQKFCEIGNQSVITQGLNSTTKVQRSFPQCLVTVYQSGTTSLATIYSNNLAIPTVLANPFTANVDGSWGFYAAPGACYDVVNSGAGFPAPFTYSYICLNAGGGGAPCPNTVINGAVGASTGNGGFACDNSFTTDFAGNFTAQSGTFRGPVNGFYKLIGGGPAPGTSPAFKLPANTVAWVAPLTVGTSYWFTPPATRGSPGQAIAKLAETTDPNGDPVITTQWQNSSAGMEVQVGGTDNANCTAGVCPLVNFVAGSNVTITNTSAGNVQISSSGGAAPQMSTPSAPTLSNNNAAGARSITYLVQCLQDGPTAAYHTLTSSTATIPNANASPQVLLKAYADTLYGPRGCDIYVTADSGARTGVPGRIANNVGKQYIDTGANANGVAATNTNTTVLDPNGLTAPLPGCNKIPAAPWGIDGPPCSATAFDDEFNWGNGVSLPGDANDPFWTWVNQNGATVTMTNGLLSISNAPGSDQLNCLVESAPGSTPYSFTSLAYYNVTIAGNMTANIAFRESATGKIVTIGAQIQNANSNGRIVIGKWTSATVNSSFPVQGTTFNSTNPEYVRIQNTGTNTVYSWSNDGIVYVTALTEAKNAFFTTAPDQVGMCFEASSGTGTIDYDYFRRTQ